MKRRTIFKTALAAIVASTMAMPAAALDRRVTIINDTNFTIVRFYGSNKGTGYCKFDFKAVFDDDDVLVANDINVCKIGTYTYH